MTHGDTMESKRGVYDKLPLELIERVLSFLSVPEMCRVRAVCKSWNEITARPSFHDLCDVNGRNNEYLFMWMEVSRDGPKRVVLNPIFSDTLSFLDVHAKRWYSIPVADGSRVCACGHEVESRFLAMNNGLVCELTTVKDCAYEKFALAISDPVARTRRTLPAPPLAVFVVPFESHVVESPIVTAVDGATRSYKVFLLNNLSVPILPSLPRVYVHESFTDEWQVLGNLPDGVEGDWASSVVILQDSLFVLKQHAEYKLSLFRYRFREDTWAGVYEMCFPRFFASSAELAVSGNRLFLSVWLAGGRSSDPECNPQFSDPGLASDPDCPHPVPLSEDPNFPDTYFEMFEVLVAESRRKAVMQLTRAQLQQIFGREEVNVHNAIPCVGSNEIRSSVVLAHTTMHMGFELRRYEWATGSVDVLPPHPLVELSDGDEEPIGEYFTLTNMKLSWRNLLGPLRPTVTPTGWRLLQLSIEDARITTADHCKGVTLNDILLGRRKVLLHSFSFVRCILLRRFICSPGAKRHAFFYGLHQGVKASHPRVPP